MLWTGLIMAALVVAQAAPATPQETPASTVAPITVQGARLESGVNTRASDPQQEVICRNQPVTGSRFNHRRCRTRTQANIASAEARSALAAMQGSGPSVDAERGSAGVPIGP